MYKGRSINKFQNDTVTYLLNDPHMSDDIIKELTLDVNAILGSVYLVTQLSELNQRNKQNISNAPLNF